MGFDPADQEAFHRGQGDPEAPFRHLYLELRKRVSLHMQTDSAPSLGLSARPVGALGWDPDTRSQLEEISLATYQ